MKKPSIKDAAYISVFTAVIAVSSFICIPLTVPITLQTFAVFLCLLLLGTKRAFAAVVLYILLGTIGIPVFSGFTGGIGKLLSPTGGFILGFMLTVPLSGWLLKLNVPRFLSLILGLAVCYLFGTVWYTLFLTDTGGATLINILTVCVIPFIIPDICKILIAMLINDKLKKTIKVFI